MYSWTSVGSTALVKDSIVEFFLPSRTKNRSSLSFDVAHFYALQVGVLQPEYPRSAIYTVFSGEDGGVVESSVNNVYTGIVLVAVQYQLCVGAVCVAK